MAVGNRLASKNFSLICEYLNVNLCGICDMTYVVNEKCIKCKLMDCVDVCPVDCFYEGENMLVINPEECIDCGVCEPECPVDAIISDTEDKDGKWLKIADIPVHGFEP